MRFCALVLALVLLALGCSRTVKRAVSEKIPGPTTDVSFEFIDFEMTSEIGRVARFRVTSHTERTILGMDIIVQTFDEDEKLLDESFTGVTSLRRWLEPGKQREDTFGSNLSAEAIRAVVKVEAIDYVIED